MVSDDNNVGRWDLSWLQIRGTLVGSLTACWEDAGSHHRVLPTYLGRLGVLVGLLSWEARRSSWADGGLMGVRARSRYSWPQPAVLIFHLASLIPYYGTGYFRVSHERPIAVQCLDGECRKQ